MNLPGGGQMFSRPVQGGPEICCCAVLHWKKRSNGWPGIPKGHPKRVRSRSAISRNSRINETRGQRRLIGGSLAAALVAFLLAGLAFWQRGQAVRNEEVAVASQEAEKIARKSEVQQRKLAERRAFDARLRAQAAEARVVLPVDAETALKQVVNATTENLQNEDQLLPEVHATLFDVLQSARTIRHVKSVLEFDFTDISAFAISSDQKKIAIVGSDMVHILDQTGKPIAPPIPAPNGRHIFAKAAVWVDNGKHLAVATGYRRGKKTSNAGLTLYDVNGQQVRRIIERHPVPITSLYAVPQTNTLVAGDEAGNIITVDLSSFNVEIKPSGSDKAIHGIVWREGRLFIAQGPVRDVTGTVRTDDIEEPVDSDEEPTETEEKEDKKPAKFAINNIDQMPETQSGGLFCLAAGSNGYPLATCGANGLISLWNFWEKKFQHDRFLRGHSGQVNTIAFHPGGRILATGGSDRKIRLWDTSGRQLVTPLKASENITALAFIDDGRKLLSGVAFGRATIWDLGDIGQSPRKLIKSDSGYSGDFIRPSNRGLYLAGNHFEKGWQITNTGSASTKKKGQATRKVRASKTGKLNDFAVSASGTMMAFAQKNVLKLAKTSDPQKSIDYKSVKLDIVKTVFASNDDVVAIVEGFNADQRPVDTRTDEEKKAGKHVKLAILDSATGKLLAAIPDAGIGKIVVLAGNPTNSGAALLTIGEKGEVRFWSAKGEPLGKGFKLPVDDSGFPVFEAAFSQDGQLVAISWHGGGLSKTPPVYRIWNTRTLKPASPPIQISGKISAISFHKERAQIAIAYQRSDENDSFGGTPTIEVRTLEGKPLIHIPAAHDNWEITSLQFSASSGDLYSIDKGGDMKRWVVSAARLAEVAKGRYENFDRIKRREELIERAFKFQSKGDWKKSREILLGARKLDPQNSTVRIRLANSFGSSTPDEQQKKLKEYDKAIELGPYNAIYFSQRGKFRHLMKDYQGAIKDFTTAERYWYCHIRGVPIIAGFIPINVIVSEWTWANQVSAVREFKRRRGRAHFAVGDWAEAETAFNTNIELDADYRAALIESLDNLSHLEEETNMNAMRKVLVDPSNTATSEMYLMRAHARARQKNYSGAIEDYNTALDLLQKDDTPYSADQDVGGEMKDPARRANQLAFINWYAANVFKATNDKAGQLKYFGAAMLEFDKAHKLAPKNPGYLINRARFKAIRGIDKSKVIADYKAASLAVPKNLVVGERYLKVLYRYKKFKRLSVEADRMLAAVSNPTITLLARKAIGDWRLEDRAGAEQAMNRLRRRPNWVSALSGGSVPLQRNEKYDLREIELSMDHGLLGARLRAISAKMALQLKISGGVLIDNVSPDGPAQKAGLVAGDVILALKDQPHADLSNFIRTWSSLAVGSIARLSVLSKDGQTKTRFVAVGRLPETVALERQISHMRNGGRYKKALGMATRHARLTLEQYGGGDLRHARSLRVLALIHRKTGGNAEAKTLLNSALEIYKNQQSVDEKSIAELKALLGKIKNDPRASGAQPPVARSSK